MKRKQIMWIYRTGGFTLIEIMIAIFILTVAILGLAAVTTTTIKGNSFSKAMTTATTLVNDKLQDLKARTFTSSSVDADLSGAVSPGVTHTDTGNPIESIYNRSWTVVDTLGSGSSIRYKTITVTVSWTWLGLSHSVQLQTIRARD